MPWPSFSAFVRDRTVRGPTLMCPVRVLWREYRTYCRNWGFAPATPGQFVAWLGMEEGIRIRTGGRGRLRRVAVGIGVTPQQEETRHGRYD